MTSCSVLVCSCDKYEEAWIPFFSLLKKYWPDCPFGLYLNTETKKCDIEGVTTINVDSKCWSERLNKALASIETEFVIVMLEDFFIQKKVDDSKIKDLIDVMSLNTDIAVFYLNRITGYKDPSPYQDFYEMLPTNQYSRYMLNCQTAIWRRSVLEHSTRTSFSPWDFEEFGYKNQKNYLKDFHFYCSNITYYDSIREKDIFSYLLIRDLGYGIWQSKWLWNNKKLFKKEGILFKPKQLPVMSKFEFKLYKCKERLKSLKKKYLGRK